MNNNLDQAVIAEYSNAAEYVDEGDIGGTAGTYITPSTSNIDKIFAAAARKLDSRDIPVAGRFALIGPRMLEQLRLYLAGKDTDGADKIGMNGKVTNRFGFEIYYSNNCAFSATWTPADNPTEAATITIAGVVLTFNATPSGAGSVNLGGNTGDTIEYLTDCINNDGTVDTDYIQLSTADRRKFVKHGIVATDGTSYLGIVGYGDISTATSAAADVWSVQYSHSLFGLKNSIDLVVQKNPNVEFRQAEKRLGKYVYPWTLYGKKTFAEEKASLVDIRLDASAWTN